MTTAIQIEKKNAKFAKLTKPQKRVAIARDALKQLRLGRVIAQHGTYMGRTVGKPLPIYPDQDGVSDDRQLCNLVPTAKCHCCALGTLFVAGVDTKNNLTVAQAQELARSNGGTREAMHEYLGDTFSQHELLKIEDYFESSWEICDAPVTLGRILRNIVRNGGKFRPNDPKDAGFAKRVRKYYGEG